MASRLDCDRRCETEEDPERVEFGGHVDVYVKFERAEGIYVVDWSSILQCQREELDDDEVILVRGDQDGDDEQYSVGAEKKRSVKGLRSVERM